MPARPNEHAATDDFEFSALAAAVNYRSALLAEFGPFLQGRILEVGAGIGQITAGLINLPQAAEVVAVEPESRFCEQFRRHLPSVTLIQGTAADLGADYDWNAIVCINVLEHIEDHVGALQEFRRRLAKNRGHVCLFVPARNEIYSPLDRDLGHFRRYSKPDLRGVLHEAGLEIVRLEYFNCVGYFAWWFNFCVLRKRHFDVSSVTLFDRGIFPAVHWAETHIARPPFGQSLLAVARAA